MEKRDDRAQISGHFNQLAMWRHDTSVTATFSNLRTLGAPRGIGWDLCPWKWVTPHDAKVGTCRKPHRFSVAQCLGMVKLWFNENISSVYHYILLVGHFSSPKSIFHQGWKKALIGDSFDFSSPLSTSVGNINRVKQFEYESGWQNSQLFPKPSVLPSTSVIPTSKDFWYSWSGGII